MKSGQTYEIIMLFILKIFIYLNMSNTIYKINFIDCILYNNKCNKINSIIIFTWSFNLSIFKKKKKTYCLLIYKEISFYVIFSFTSEDEK